MSATSPRLAIVTGGAGAGLGSGITGVLAEQGWHVLIVDRDEAAAQRIEQQLTGAGRAVRTLVADLTQDDAPQRVVEAAMDWRGRIDGLVNNAGVGLPKPVEQISDDEYDRVMNINVRAVFRLCRAVLPVLRAPGGAVVNLASVHGRQPMPGFSVYGATKGAIEAFTRGLAVEYGPRGIRVNCVAPGMVDCVQTRQVMGEVVDDVDAYLKGWTQHNQLLPKLVNNRDVGELIAFLLSERSAGLTAQTLVHDAGTLSMIVDR